MMASLNYSTGPFATTLTTTIFPCILSRSMFCASCKGMQSSGQIYDLLYIEWNKQLYSKNRRALLWKAKSLGLFLPKLSIFQVLLKPRGNSIWSGHHSHRWQFAVWKWPAPGHDKVLQRMSAVGSSLTNVVDDVKRLLRLVFGVDLEPRGRKARCVGSSLSAVHPSTSSWTSCTLWRRLPDVMGVMRLVASLFQPTLFPRYLVHSCLWLYFHLWRKEKPCVRHTENKVL